MTKHYTPANNRQVVQNWWAKTQSHLALFLEVMTSSGHINNNELKEALQYITVRRNEFEKMPYPPATEKIHTELSKALSNLQQSLDYRINGNLFHAQSRLNMAQANLDIVRLHLIQFGIIS